MLKHYYIGEGSEADALVAEVIKNQESVRIARHSICVEYNTDGLVLGSHGKIEGLSFKERQYLPYLKGEMRFPDGYGYYPKLNCKAGKKLAEKLSDPALTFSASDYIVETLKVPRMVAGKHAASRTGLALFYSVAGIADGKILVSIPGDDTGVREGGVDPMPNVPTWLREVKESEWLAAQGE